MAATLPIGDAASKIPPLRTVVTSALVIQLFGVATVVHNIHDGSQKWLPCLLTVTITAQLAQFYKKIMHERKDSKNLYDVSDIQFPQIFYGSNKSHQIKTKSQNTSSGGSRSSPRLIDGVTVFAVNPISCFLARRTAH